MLVASAPKASPSISSLKERHHEIKRLLLQGNTQREVARRLGMSDSWLSIICSSPVFVAEMERWRLEADKQAADVSSRVKNLAPDAMTVLEQAVRGRKLPDGKLEPVEGMNKVQHTKFALEALALAGHTKPLSAQPTTAPIKVEIVQFGAGQPIQVNVQQNSVTLLGPDEDSTDEPSSENTASLL